MAKGNLIKLIITIAISSNMIGELTALFLFFTNYFLELKADSVIG